jgi:hypothetical protein
MHYNFNQSNPEPDSTGGKNKKKCHIQGNIENKAENPLELLDCK